MSSNTNFSVLISSDVPAGDQKKLLLALRTEAIGIYTGSV